MSIVAQMSNVTKGPLAYIKDSNLRYLFQITRTLIFDKGPVPTKINN